MLPKLFGFHHPVDRTLYLRAGVALMILKYAVDTALIGLPTGIAWTPIDYLIPLLSYRSAKLALFPTWLSVLLAIWTLPFLWIGVSMTIRRAVDAGRSPWHVLWFFVPIVNYGVMLWLSILPSAPREGARARSIDADATDRFRSAMIGILVSLSIGIGVWDAPNRLAFTVAEQPSALRELTPYAHIEPPHLDDYFKSVRGEFRLSKTDDGRTLLEGTTWYQLKVYPEAYWRPIAEWLVGRIHDRILRQIKRSDGT